MKRNQKEGVSLKETEKSNYDQVIENWRLKFLEMDQEKLTRKFHLEADEEALYRPEERSDYGSGGASGL